MDMIWRASGVNQRKARRDKRTTVSLAAVIWEMAEDLMQAKGFNENFSAYIADLIRRDKEREEAREAQRKPNSSSGDTEHIVLDALEKDVEREHGARPKAKR